MAEGSLVRVVTGLIGGVAACVLCTSAMAATLTSNGTVLVNKGQGFKPVTGTQQVQLGDNVMVQNGSAQITFNDGSVMQLPEGGTYAVPATAPPPIAPGAGGFALTPATVAVGGLVVGGVVAGTIYATAGNSSSSPATTSSTASSPANPSQPGTTIVQAASP